MEALGDVQRDLCHSHSDTTLQYQPESMFDPLDHKARREAATRSISAQSLPKIHPIPRSLPSLSSYDGNGPGQGPGEDPTACRYLGGLLKSYLPKAQS